MEYKRTLSIGGQEDRAEFLADISSFANASGGDIIFGISDERDANGKPTGIPEAIVPLSVESLATERGKIEQIIESGIQPRIPVVHVRDFDIPGHGIVILVRVGKSWIGPHMVAFANRSRFYSRNSSTGKLQLDVQQIGAAFAEQRGMGERLRSWKTDRIAKAVAGEGPVRLEGPHLLFHFVTAAALTDGEQSLPRKFDPLKWGQAYRLMSLSPESQRYNADGFLTVSRQALANHTQSYLQVFRDGSLEYGDSYVVGDFDGKLVPSQILEEKLIEIFERANSLLTHLDVIEPVYVSLTLVRVRGMMLALPQYAHMWKHTSEPFDRDIVVCPDMQVQNTYEGSPYRTTLFPIVNAVWQAAGLAQSPYKQRWGVD